MRSRASGGICGDSVAATSADDHVELAPPRDLDAAREVDGAQLDRRARERAHDRAGVAGVASSRSQASTSRISARWKNAAAPTSR